MTSRHRFFMSLWLASAFSWIVSGRPLVAVDCSVATTLFGVSSGNSFDLSTTGFSSFDIQAGVDYWSCPGYTGYIPSFQIGGSGGVPVLIGKLVGRSTLQDGSCGQFDPDIVNGNLESATITVWTHHADGTSCEPLTDVIAHELGHLLGLADAPDPQGACLNHIMGARVEGFTRTVNPDDCQVADQKWETVLESQPNDPYCEAYCPTFCIGSLCDGHPSPILIDLENDGVHLTGLDDPVWFDIDADGALDLLSWTNRSEGFLALDRNGNGTIDNGGELFGNVTRLANGSRPLNGYQALADLDSWVYSGNGDGHLDAADPAFSSLLLWTDRNHDGISQPEELQTVNQATVRRIDLEYRRSRRTDRYGNIFAFAGRAWKGGPHGVVHPIITWDVYFSKVP